MFSEFCFVDFCLEGFICGKVGINTSREMLRLLLPRTLVLFIPCYGDRRSLKAQASDWVFSSNFILWLGPRPFFSHPQSDTYESVCVFVCMCGCVFRVIMPKIFAEVYYFNVVIVILSCVILHFITLHTN